MEQLFSTSYQVKEDEERIKAELERQTSNIIVAGKPDSPEGWSYDLCVCVLSETHLMCMCV